jgi:heptosyltransferase-2
VVLIQRIIKIVENGVLRLVERSSFNHRPLRCQSIGKVLIVRNNDLGDVLLATPMFRAIKQHLPQAEVHACVGPWARELLLGNPHVDKIWAFDFPWGNKRLNGGWLPAFKFLSTSSVAAQLRAEQYDVGIDVAGNFWTAWLLKKAEVRFCIGIGGYQGGGVFHDCSVPFSTREHVSRMGLRLLEPLGIFSSDTTLELRLSEEDDTATRSLLREAGILDAGFVVISPGVAWPPSKAWIPEYFVRVGQLFSHQFGWRSVITGSASESALTASVAQAIGPSGHDLGGRTSVRQLAGLIKQAKVVICNSSVSMHIAQAVGTPCVVIVGGTEGGRSFHHRLWGYPNGCAVLGTDERDCAVECSPYCQTKECMRAVAPEQVFDAALALLTTSSSRLRALVGKWS